MIVIDGATYLTLTETATVLGRSRSTITKWAWKRRTPTGRRIPMLRDSLSRALYIPREFVIGLRDDLMEEVRIS